MLARKTKRKVTGTVVSANCKQTIVVKVTRRYKHKQYGKNVTASKKYYAHDEESKAKAGDAVTIVESRPRSKLKKWELFTINSI